MYETEELLKGACVQIAVVITALAGMYAMNVCCITSSGGFLGLCPVLL